MEMVLRSINLFLLQLLSLKRPSEAFFLLLRAKAQEKIWSPTLDLVNEHDKEYYRSLLRAKKGMSVIPVSLADPLTAP
jgi:hypothetical protein